MYVNEYAPLKDGVLHIRFYRLSDGHIIGRATLNLIPWELICMQ